MKTPELITSLAIIGDSDKQWPQIKEFCDQSVHDKSGIAAGILSREIETNFGLFTVKFLLLFVDQKLPRNIKPTFQYTVDQVEEEGGIENILLRIGRKTIIRAQMKQNPKIHQ